MEWRNLIPGLAGPKNKVVEKATLAESLDEMTYLQNLVSKLQAINQQQTIQIHYLKEINFRLDERNKALVDFVQKGGLAQQEESQEDALSAIGRINEDLDPIFCRLELGEEVSPDTVQNLRSRSQRVRAQILEIREQFKKERQELLDKLSEKELSLRLTQSDLESIYNENKQLKEEIRLLHLKISRQEEDALENANLRLSLSNELQSLKKKCHLLESSRERFDTTQNMFQENESLKKALFQMDEKLHLANRQRNRLQLEYEKLLGEYERLFTEI